MPKVYLSESARAIARFRKWYYSNKMARGVTDELIGRKLGKTHQAVSRKMSLTATGTITLEEMVIIFKEMQATNDEILKVFGRREKSERANNRNQKSKRGDDQSAD